MAPFGNVKRGKLCNASDLRLVREVAPADQGSDPDSELRFVSSNTCNCDIPAQLAGMEPLSRAAPVIRSSVRFIKLDQLAGSEPAPVAAYHQNNKLHELALPVFQLHVYCIKLKC